MRELSMCDMELVSGAVGPVGAAIGAGAAAAGYIGYAIGTGEGNMTDFLGATGAGAIGGFFFGPAGGAIMQTGAHAVLQPTIGFYGGMAAGFGMSALDSAGTNYGDRSGTGYN